MQIWFLNCWKVLVRVTPSAKKDMIKFLAPYQTDFIFIETLDATPTQAELELYNMLGYSFATYDENGLMLTMVPL